MPAPKRQTREQMAHVETYTPVSDIAIPEEIRTEFREKGYFLKWVRATLGPEAKQDRKSLSRKIREGYEFVEENEVPEYKDFCDKAKLMGRTKNALVVGDVVLMKIPIPKANARREYFDQRAAEQDEKARMATDREARKLSEKGVGTIDSSRLSKREITAIREREVDFGLTHEDGDEDNQE